MTKDEYSLYLQTDYWKEIRKKKLFSKKRRRCQICHKSGRLHIHHLSYANLWNERLEDLLILCEECHFDLHDQLEGDY